MLVAVTLLVVLYSIMLSPSARTYQMGKIAVCANNLRNIEVALKTFAVDSNGRLPFATNAETSETALSVLVPRYTTGSGYFICPGSGDRRLPDAKPFADRKISYAYYMGHGIDDGADQPLITDRQVNTRFKQTGDLLFSPDGKKPGNNHNKYGGNVMFCNGATKWSAPVSAFTLTNTPGVTLLNPKP